LKCGSLPLKVRRLGSPHLMMNQQILNAPT
jgi:hypothetical protein